MHAVVGTRKALVAAALLTSREASRRGSHILRLKAAVFPVDFFHEIRPTVSSPAIASFAPRYPVTSSHSHDVITQEKACMDGTFAAAAQRSVGPCE